MKGFVPTPAETVDLMIDMLFRSQYPAPTDFILDPGCGEGAFIDGVLRWCSAHCLPLPGIVGVESDPKHVAVLRTKYAGVEQVRIEHRNFLTASARQFRFIIGNPPYVPITRLSEDEKRVYRSSYATARGRFDLYLLFFEQALLNLAPAGRLVFITPEKYLYVETAGALRNLLAKHNIPEIWLLPEDTFGELVTYPTISVIENSVPGPTRFRDRGGIVRSVALRPGYESWISTLRGASASEGGAVLADVCCRVSCGVATGADSVFVKRSEELTPELRSFSRPTISGRQIGRGQPPGLKQHMLMPYDDDGRLLPETRLGALGDYLREAATRAKLVARTCVRRKPWYAFHETPVLPDILRPKILCKDICESPEFIADLSGELVPRHSVYYLVPDDASQIPVLLDYLRSGAARQWLEENSQRASKGFLRMQSHVLQRLPLPNGLIRSIDVTARTAQQFTLVTTGR